MSTSARAWAGEGPFAAPAARRVGRRAARRFPGRPAVQAQPAQAIRNTDMARPANSPLQPSRATSSRTLAAARTQPRSTARERQPPAGRRGADAVAAERRGRAPGRRAPAAKPNEMAEATSCGRRPQAPRLDLGERVRRVIANVGGLLRHERVDPHRQRRQRIGLIAALRSAANRRLDVVRDLDARDVHVLPEEHVADEPRGVLGTGCSGAAASGCPRGARP